jgi:hypothetical protein
MVSGKDRKNRNTEQKRNPDRTIPRRPRSNFSPIVPKNPDTNVSSGTRVHWLFAGITCDRQIEASWGRGWLGIDGTVEPSEPTASVFSMPDGSAVNFEDDPIFQELMAEGLAMQHRFAAEPIFAKTGKGFLISEGVAELERLKASLKSDRRRLPVVSSQDGAD